MSVRLWKLDVLVKAYEQYQVEVRGLSKMTAHLNARAVTRCLRSVLGDDPIDLRRLYGSAVVRFVVESATRSGPRMADAFAHALRSFFRYLRVRGLHDARLDEVVPSVHFPGRLATVPTSLTEEQFDQLLASLSGSTPSELRDRALVLMLARLGLRPVEVASLRLTDIDWCLGGVRVARRKTGHGAVLPLPADVGHAVAAYLLDGRPDSDSGRVFVRHKYFVGRPLRAVAVSYAVTQALRRAGIAESVSGAYVLRHTLATRMVRRGAKLKEIADVLGHRCLDTTGLYAKVDLPSLRQVAMPWPEVTP